MSLRIFYTSDLHGSEKCFKKFINAGKFYGVQILIMGGDITGKLIIPIIEDSNGSFQFAFSGRDYHVTAEGELRRVEQQISDSGYYPYRATAEEASKLAQSEDERNGLFRRLMVERVKRWVALAEEKMEKSGIRCYIMPGNDDIFEIDAVLQNSQHIIMPEGRAIELNESYEMISTGYANITPWKCPRDVREEELEKKIEVMVSKVRNIENCIFNFHCPPYDSGIDEAPKLDKDLTPTRTSSGELMLEPVGSVAVRRSIEKYQPLLGLHGHIHEARGSHRIGRTWVLNCGSEYSEGILHGVLVTLEDGKAAYQFTSG